MHSMRWLAGLLLALPGLAAAADVCGDFARKLQSSSYGDRIAGVACHESLLWYRPFIDRDGRLASITLTEAESGLLSDGTPAWQRVAGYWRGSGLLWQMQHRSDASACGVAASGIWQSASCRAFVLDTPWSAAFLSFVMSRAGVPGFSLSGSHVDYVRDAYRQSPSSPYLLVDPASSRASPGDLLCFVRSPNRVFGHAGLRQFLGGGEGGLAMHCDIVVANNLDGDGMLSLVGGNVLQGVTQRQLAVNREGMLWNLPTRTGQEPYCAPHAPGGCNFNRQDWAALLKLRPLPPATTPVAPLGGSPAPERRCCVHCVLGADPPVPRCPRPDLSDTP